MIVTPGLAHRKCTEDISYYHHPQFCSIWEQSLKRKQVVCDLRAQDVPGSECYKTIEEISIAECL